VQDLDFNPFVDEVVASVSEDATLKVWNFKDKLTPEEPLADDVLPLPHAPISHPWALPAPGSTAWLSRYC
jgi:hypothetical protein